MRLFWIAAIASVVLGGTAPPHAIAAQSLTGQDRAEFAGRGLVGSPAPRVVLTTLDGQKIDLGSLYGKKAVYLKFWATWCTPCRQQMPHFEHAYQTRGTDLEVIGINIGFDDPIEDVRKFRHDFGIHMPIVRDDGSLASAFNLRVTPQHIVIGRDGRIQYVGHLADQRVDAALLKARAADPALEAAGNTPVDAPRYRRGDHLPDVSVPTLDGRTFKVMDAHAGQPTVLVFLSPWCESYLATSRPEVAARCRQVREQVEALARDNKGARWLAIASGLWATQEDLSDYQTKYQTQIPLTLDESGRLFRSFRVMNVPAVVLADANGRIVRRVDGFDPGLATEIRNVMRP